MGLLQLPFEILDDIIRLTLPSEFEALALSCKAVHACAARHAQRHNALKRQWKYTARTDARKWVALSVLREIARDPLVALYIETLCLWDSGPSGVGAAADFEVGPMDEMGIREVRELV